VAVGSYQYADGSVSYPLGLLITGTGTSWTATEAPLPANANTTPGSAYVTLSSVSCASADNCIAVGEYADSSGHHDGLLLTFSGTSWTATEAPLPAGADADPMVSLSSVACPSTAACVAVGQYSDSSGDPQGLLLSGSGTSWTATEAPLPAGSAGGNLTAVTCSSPAQCVAVGSYSSGLGLLLSGSGTSWTASEAPLPADASATPEVQLTAIACTSASACVVSGNYLNSSGAQQVVETGSGTNWTATEVPPPSGGAFVDQTGTTPVACPATNMCVAVGDYFTDLDTTGLGMLMTGS
jgi:hypothetical protein